MACFRFLCYMVSHRVLPLFVAIVSFYYVFIYNIVCFDILGDYLYAESYDMDTGCPLGNITCTPHNKLVIFGRSRNQGDYVGKGVIILVIETTFCTLIGVVIAGLYSYITFEYNLYMNKDERYD